MSEESLERLEETVRWITIARKNLAAYPPGHPALAASFERANRQLQDLLGSGGQVRFSVLRNALLCEGEKLLSPHAQDLAQLLYRRDVAILQIDAAIEPWELEALLRVISVDPRKAGETPLSEVLASQSVRHAQLGMVNYESIRMTTQVHSELATEEKTQLSWGTLLGSLQSASGEEPADDVASGEVSATEVAALIRRMFQQEQATARENALAVPADPTEPATASPTIAAVTDALSDYASRLKSEERRFAGQQLARLISLLPEEFRHVVLSSAMKAFSEDADVSEDLKSLDASLAKGSALEALMREASEPSPASPAPGPALSLPATPEPSPEPPPVPVRRASAEDLKRSLEEIAQGEDVDRFNPEASPASLGQTGIRLPELIVPEGPTPDLGDRPESLGEEPVMESLTQTLLEMLDAPPLPDTAAEVMPRLEDALRYFLNSGQFEQAVLLVHELKAKITDPRVSAEVIVPIQDCLGRISSRETAVLIVERLPQLGEQSLDRLGRIVAALEAPAIRSLLSALAEERDPSQRRRILDFLVSLGPAIAPEARGLLVDPRWFIVRNMLYLLRSVGDRASLPEVRRCINHPDVRVRLEAIKTVYAFDPNVPRDLIWKMIFDPDPKSAETAVIFAGTYGISEAVDPLLAILNKWDPFGWRRSLRLKALQSLGELADARALDRLKRYFRDSLVPVVAREERIAAYRSLEGYAEPVRRPLVQAGLKSRLPEIREICERLRGRPRPSPAMAAPKAKND